MSVPPGMVRIMFEGLDDIDWASMEHAYGTAEEVPALLWALRSPHTEERRKALDRFYGAVHHQGSVYPSTAASLPFLFELAADGTTPERAAVVALLVSIGRESLDQGFEDDGTEIEYYPPMGCGQAVVFLRERVRSSPNLPATATRTCALPRSAGSDSSSTTPTGPPPCCASGWPLSKGSRRGCGSFRRRPPWHCACRRPCNR